MTIPWQEPLTPRTPSQPQVPEPRRKGEDGGPSCTICTGVVTEPVWSDDDWTLHPPTGGSLPGTVWLASRAHVDSFCDLPDDLAAGFGPIVARIERAVLARGGVGRVHVYRWGDGGAHFHLWFLPRPLGMMDATGPMLPLWEDVMENVSDDELRRAAEEVAAGMLAVAGTRS